MFSCMLEVSAGLINLVEDLSVQQMSGSLVMSLLSRGVSSTVAFAVVQLVITQEIKLFSQSF